MAVTREKRTFALDLGQLVSDQTDIFNAFKKRFYYNQEVIFQDKVINENLSLDAQLAYRQKQIEDNKKTNQFSVDQINDLKDKVKVLQKATKYQKARDKYYTSYNLLQAGKETNQTHLDNLKGLLNDATDQDLRNFLQTNISQTEKDVITASQNIMKNKVTLAAQDKTAQLVNDTLSEISKQKGEAILNNQDEWLSSLNTYENSLKKILTQNQIQDSLHDFEQKALSTGANAYDKVNLLNSQIGSADSTTPIDVANIKYASAREYWTTMRDKYIAGQGSGLFSDFFTELTNDYQNHLDSEAAKNKSNAIPAGILDTVSSEIKSLLTRPEFASYIQKAQDFYGNVMNYGVNQSAKAIIFNASKTENWDKAISELDALGTRYGLDQTANKLLLTSQKGEAVISAGQQLTQTIENIATNISTQEGISYDEALKKATALVEKSGVGTQTISPAAAAEMKPMEIAKSQLLGTEVPATKTEEKFPVPSYTEQKPAPTPENKFASVQAVFGQTWQPSAIFTQKGLVEKGIFGAVKVKGMPNVYTIGPGGVLETPESYKQKFGTAEQKGIVGEVSPEQAKQLGIKL